MRILASVVNLLQGEHSSRERISLLWVCVCASVSVRPSLCVHVHVFRTPVWCAVVACALAAATCYAS